MQVAQKRSAGGSCRSSFLAFPARFLSGMNPMTNSRNCTCQQSSVNCRDQCVCTKVSVQNVLAGSQGFCMHVGNINTAVLQPDPVRFISSSTCARQTPTSKSIVISHVSQSQDCSNVLIMRSRSATVCLAAFSSCCRACHCMHFIGSIVCTSIEGGTETLSPILWDTLAVV